MVVMTSFPPPDQGVRLRQENTDAHVQSKHYGIGTLFIAESRVSWLGANGQGFSLEYKAISLHAISRDTSSFPRQCLYLMIAGDLNEATQNGSTESSSEEDEESKVSEIRFAPANPEALEEMYKQMSACTILHPDDDATYSDDESDGGDAGDDDGEEGYFEGEDGMQNLTPEGQATLSRLNAMLDPGDDGIGADAPPSVAATAENTGSAGAPNDEPMDAQFEDADS